MVKIPLLLSDPIKGQFNCYLLSTRNPLSGQDKNTSVHRQTKEDIATWHRVIDTWLSSTARCLSSTTGSYLLSLIDYRLISLLTMIDWNDPAGGDPLSADLPAMSTGNDPTGEDA